MSNSLRRVAAVLSFLLLAVAPSSAYRPYLTPQRLVDIGHGRRLNIYCTGAGSPTVILDTDQDSSIVDWRFVQPAIAKTTRVCAYDAAGLGFSDPAPRPRDAQAYMRDLHALLERAGVERPYVLVGYAFSSLSERLYADTYPHDIAGMVFVDPLVPFRNKRLAELVPALAPIADDRAFISSLQMCRDAAHLGKLHAGTPQFKECMWSTGPTDPALPVAVQRILQQQWQRPAAWDDLIAAAQADDKSSAEVGAAQKSYGSMPLVVLTSDIRVDLTGMPLSSIELRRVAKAYQSWHRQIAALSSRGQEFVVASSTASNMPIEHAARIIKAVQDVVRQIRKPDH